MTSIKVLVVLHMILFTFCSAQSSAGCVETLSVSNCSLEEFADYCSVYGSLCLCKNVESSRATMDVVFLLESSAMSQDMFDRVVKYIPKLYVDKIQSSSTHVHVVVYGTNGASDLLSVYNDPTSSQISSIPYKGDVYLVSNACNFYMRERKGVSFFFCQVNCIQKKKKCIGAGLEYIENELEWSSANSARYLVLIAANTPSDYPCANLPTVGTQYELSGIDTSYLVALSSNAFSDFEQKFSWNEGVLIDSLIWVGDEFLALLLQQVAQQGCNVYQEKIALAEQNGTKEKEGKKKGQQKEKKKKKT
ncbi:hypothetical protein RFI_12732 [Reticulomyxa filosa]|uniref:VWFA domain-containing protein n=1 Tax=Reticulomyxa filosa TaxID=46433 RepID=X6NEP2_RETFI|nr:hypothetical protein RFI_12732 [Reticulomyxa filosa]|eukprot:ETO24426.1 hypothetical protein RFI_12732 [Reticulomyxa filosa]